MKLSGGRILFIAGGFAHRAGLAREYWRGDDFATRFGPGGFLRLSESIDVHSVDPADVCAPTTLVSFDTDTLVPTWLVEELAGAASGITKHVENRSEYGHDGFLKEVALVSDVIRSTLGSEGAIR